MAVVLAGCGQSVRTSYELANPATYKAADDSFVQTCDGCHASDGLSAGSPPRPVPRLHGQQVVYIVSALKAYRDGTRTNPTMREAAAGLSDDQIAIAARALAGGPLPRPSLEGAPPPPTVQGVCAGCHGQTGLGVIPEYPKIGGQHQAYLKAALEDYRAWRRLNPIMRTIALELTPEQIDAVSTYFASHGGLAPATP